MGVQRCILVGIKVQLLSVRNANIASNRNKQDQILKIGRRKYMSSHVMPTAYRLPSFSTFKI